jgi:hypothetical protein
MSDEEIYDEYLARKEQHEFDLLSRDYERATQEIATLKAAVLQLSEALGDLQGHADASLLFPHKERMDLFNSERRARETLARYEELLKQIKDNA